MGQSEHQVQKAFFDWAKLHPRAKRAYAIPNAAKRSMRLAAMMKAEGLRKGVLDVHLPIPAGGCAGLWLEFKAGKNKLTPEQDAEVSQLVDDGYCVAVCYETTEAIDITTAYLSGSLVPCVIWSKAESSRSKRQAQTSSSRST